jgi:hypothetical protein
MTRTGRRGGTPAESRNGFVTAATTQRQRGETNCA